MHRLERWRPVIQGATTESQLLTVMREYCSSWLPSEISKLPDGCPKCEVADTDDIQALALDFTAYELKYDGSDEVKSMLRDMALVFTAAAQHLKRFRPGPLG
jgi:hypothetical protein